MDAPRYLSAFIVLAILIAGSTASENYQSSDVKATKDLCTLINLINNDQIVDEQTILTKITLLVKQGADINVHEGSPYETTFLHLAVSKGLIDVVRFLLSNGAHVNEKVSLFQETPLYSCTSFDIFNLLLEHGADINARDLFDCTPLYRACKSDDYCRAKVFIERSANVHMTCNHQLTCLHWAALNGNVELVQLLVSNGANIHAIDDLGDSPLNEACFRGHVNAAWLLIMYGAKVDIPNIYGNTPLYYVGNKPTIGIKKLSVTDNLEDDQEQSLYYTMQKTTVGVKNKLKRLLLTGNLQDYQEEDPHWFYLTDFMEQIITTFSQALAPLDDWRYIGGNHRKY
jgi:ankyrin repeat protein